MRTLTTLLAGMAFTLALVAVPGLSAANGISVLTGPASLDDGTILIMTPASAHADDLYVEGASPGGLRPDRELYNAVTDFGEAVPAGIREAASGRGIHNGITGIGGQPVLFE